MTKTELIQTVAVNTETSRDVAKKIINEIFEVIKSEVAAGNDVVIQNFGIFKLLDRDERKGRNPRTGEEIIIAAHKLPIFKAGKNFKDAAN